MAVTWQLRGKPHDLSKRGMIMGILNVTPDSFSDGGSYVHVEKAIQHGLRMVEDGADIIDIGGESTRPGAAEVPADEEISRVIPVIRALRERTNALISIDTMKGRVAGAAILAGADIVNDVNGLREPEMLAAVASTDVAVVVMHMQGQPRTMQVKPRYDDVVTEVRDFFSERLETLHKAGIHADRVALDPGFGFGKTLDHNIELLRALPQLRVNECPLLVGVSRKSMIAGLLGDKDMNKRFWPTVALTAWMREAGAEISRVHDVQANAHAMRMMEAIMTGAGAGTGV